jgi:hypothetical protein
MDKNQAPIPDLGPFLDESVERARRQIERTTVNQYPALLIFKQPDGWSWYCGRCYDTSRTVSAIDNGHCTLCHLPYPNLGPPVPEYSAARKLGLDPSGPKWVSVSGASSSERRPAYEQIYLGFLKRLGARFALGEEKHDRGNWLRAYKVNAKDSAYRYDIDFLRDRYNHAVEHLLSLSTGTKDDDHLGAVGWFLSMAAEAEEVYGVNWQEILRVGTPEEEAKLRERMGFKP